jgi:hypothetical protein
MFFSKECALPDRKHLELQFLNFTTHHKSPGRLFSIHDWITLLPRVPDMVVWVESNNLHFSGSPRDVDASNLEATF